MLGTAGIDRISPLKRYIHVPLTPWQKNNESCFLCMPMYTHMYTHGCRLPPRIARAAAASGQQWLARQLATAPAQPAVWKCPLKDSPSYRISAFFT